MQPPGHTAHHPDYTNLAFSERLYCPVRRKQEQKVSNKKGALTENINCSLWFKTVFIKIAFLGSGCVAQLVERSLSIPEVRGSNPVIGKNLLISNICVLSTVYWKDENKEKEAGNGPFFKNRSFTKSQKEMSRGNCSQEQAKVLCALKHQLEPSSIISFATRTPSKRDRETIWNFFCFCPFQICATRNRPFSHLLQLLDFMWNRTSSSKCDQITKLCFQYLAIFSKKMCPIAYKLCQSELKTLPKTK